MSTSIITTTTFTFATMIDIRGPLSPAAPLALESELEEVDIGACEFAALPRCGWAVRKRCTHGDSCRS